MRSSVTVTDTQINDYFIKIFYILGFNDLYSCMTRQGMVEVVLYKDDCACVRLKLF